MITITTKIHQGIEDIKRRQTGAWSGQFSIGRGWWRLASELNEQLKEIDPTYSVQQVKEKFGAMRFYAQPSEGLDSELVRMFHKAIRRADEASTTICERCGRPARQRAMGLWVSTLCEDDYQEAKAERAKLKQEMKESSHNRKEEKERGRIERTLEEAEARLDAAEKRLQATE